MTTIQRVFWVHMLAAVAALSTGYAITGHPFAALVVVFVGLLWFTARQRNAAGVEGLLLTLFILAGGIGFWLGVPGWLGLIGVVAAMGAWDLDHFLQRLSAVERVEFDSGLGREHLRRLGLVELIGLVIGFFALTFRIEVPFWVESLFVLLAIIGIWQIIRFVRKQMEE